MHRRTPTGRAPRVAVAQVLPPRLFVSHISPLLMIPFPQVLTHVPLLHVAVAPEHATPSCHTPAAEHVCGVFGALGLQRIAPELHTRH